MLISRREALDELLAHVGESGDPKARNKAERALNRAIERIWQKHAWRDYLLPAPYELTLVSGTRSYGLPDYFGRLGKGQVRNLTQGGVLAYIAPDALQDIVPEAGTSLEAPGTPRYYTLDGTTALAVQPSSAGEALEVLSSSASDTNVVVTIAGQTANGWERLSFTLDGTTPVAVGTWLPTIDEFGKSVIAGTDPTTELTSSVGTVTLRTVSGSTTRGTLLSQESARSLPQITFYPEPNVTDVIGIPVQRRPKRLLFDGDIVPQDWWPAIFEYLVLTWRSNTGEGSEPGMGWPALVDLIHLENAKTPVSRTRPFPQEQGW